MSFAVKTFGSLPTAFRNPSVRSEHVLRSSWPPIRTAAYRASSRMSCDASVQSTSAAELFKQGEKFLHDEGVVKNKTKAMECFWKAAELKFAPAQYYLGGLYKLGQEVPQNQELATSLILEAANQNHGEAVHVLGWMYETGNGVPQSYEEAMKCYKRASELGEEGARDDSIKCYVRNILLKK